MKKISVIIPVYNAERFLKNCIDSVLCQTYPVYEIILINDGSTDSSKEICESYERLDSRIRLFNKANEGVSKARNLGLDMASGELISFIDSDDALESDMYEYLIHLLDNYQADIAHCGYKKVNDNDLVIDEFFGTHIVLEQNSDTAIRYMLEGKCFTGGLWNKLFKRGVIQNTRFEESLKNNEDILFNALVFQNASKLIFGDETKYLYYVHMSSVCHTLSAETKTKDSRLAANILLSNSKTQDVKDLALRWMFSIVLQAYKLDLMDNQSNYTQKNEDRVWLKKNYKHITNARLNDKVSYYLSVFFPSCFRIVYRINKWLRKPQWDPQK